MNYIDINLNKFNVLTNDDVTALINDSLQSYQTIIEELQNKINDLEQSSKSANSIIEQNINEYNGYILYKNGYCEQYGRKIFGPSPITGTVGSLGLYDSVTLLKPYSNNQYNVQLTLGEWINLGSNSNCDLWTKDISNDKFNIYLDLKDMNTTDTTIIQVFWKTCGIITQ